MGIFSGTRDRENLVGKGKKTSGKFRHCLNILGLPNVSLLRGCFIYRTFTIWDEYFNSEITEMSNLSDGLEILGQF